MNFNGKEYLKNCLDSIKRNTNYGNHKILVLDNNSKDGSKKLIKTKYFWVDLIENLRNEGASRTLNIGIKYAIKKYNPDYFYFLNNDTIVKKNWLTEAIKTAEKRKDIGIVGSKQLTFDKKPAISAGWIKFLGVKYYWGDEEKEVNWVSGAGFLVKKEVIKKIGVFDETYNPAYYEESDFEKRVINAGFRIINCPRSVIYHKGSGTIGNFKDNKYFSIFYRNRLIFFLRHYSFFYFFPRLIYDILKSIRIKKLRLLFKAYKEGIMSVRAYRKSCRRS
jgi:hypothetical protein